MKGRLWIAAIAFCSSACGGINAIELSNYDLTNVHMLPATASEASAVTFNWDTGTLFVLGDEGDFIVEVTTQGQFVSQMTLTGFEDTEGLTYLGKGQFVIVEERIQDVFLMTYSAGASIDRNALPGISLGLTVGNIGLEGISFDPIANQYIVVKEKTPQGVMVATLDWSGPSGSVTDLFVPNLGVLDLSDVQVLNTVSSLAGTPDHENLLIYSQESSKLMEVTRTGTVMGEFSFAGIAADAEGVTIGPDGTIYVVGETPALYILIPTPRPCPPDVTGNSVVDVDDLLAVINGWGTCVDPESCLPDIAPSGGNDVVDVDDLLVVINGWGQCQ